MDKEFKILVNNLTQDVIDIFDIPVPVQDIRTVVKKLGGHVEECFSMDTTGSSVKREENGFVIVLSPFYSADKEKYAVAQELGHLFLHMGYRISPKLWKRQDYRIESQNPSL